MSRLYAGWIENYDSNANNRIRAGMIQSYSPDPGDTIIICSSPKGVSTDSDDVNVSIEFDYMYYEWTVVVSDTSYSGDIAFSVITPETPTPPTFNNFGFYESDVTFAVSAGPPPV